MLINPLKVRFNLKMFILGKIITKVLDDLNLFSFKRLVHLFIILDAKGWICNHNDFKNHHFEICITFISMSLLLPIVTTQLYRKLSFTQLCLTMLEVSMIILNFELMLQS